MKYSLYFLSINCTFKPNKFCSISFCSVEPFHPATWYYLYCEREMFAFTHPPNRTSVTFPGFVAKDSEVRSSIFHEEGKMSFVVGDRFWIPDEDDAWMVGTLKSATSAILEFSTDKGIKKIKVSEAKLEACGSHIDDHVENLVDLDELSEGAILHHTRLRFQKKMIYTHVGSILVAVNPFENLPIYGDKDIRRAAESTQAYPHVFVTAATAYQQLRNNMKNQSVLISGESGAGKTETTKKVLTYLANVAPDHKAKKSPGEPGMEDKILQSNPLLEALGNAKTLRNNNSSRFGKWMKVGMNNQFLIQGCEIINYLLEKSRVVTQSSMERNYHIFYQLIAGADSVTRKRLHLRPPSEFNYLNQSGCSIIDGVDDGAEFKDVLQAMGTLQFSSSTVESMLKIIAGILLLGNITFDQGSDSSTSKISPKSKEDLAHCAELLGVNQDMFTYCLTEKKMQVGKGSIIGIVLSVAQAEENRDTIAKTMYSNMFDWTIVKVNSTLKSPTEAPYSIGILDIFGFEVFELNSFEQLCINYANEKLQFHFNQVIFNEETEMYKREGVPTEEVHFEDNKECVELIEHRHHGLLAYLEEECNLGNNATDMSYIAKCEKNLGSGKAHTNKFFVKHKTKPEIFSVRHFAGAVEYNVTNFLDKNRDTLSITAREVMQQSAVPLISELFTPAAAVGDTANKKQSHKTTLGTQFRNQLIGLLTTLNSTEPHFIRCVKPNHAKVGGKFDGQLALRQLQYAGLFEAIRIRKSGYAYRATFRVFANSYQILVDGLSQRRERKLITDQDCCREILAHATKEKLLEPKCSYVGETRVFLKTNAHRTVLERQKVSRVAIYAMRIQQHIRAYVVRLKANAEKFAALKEAARLAAEKEKQGKAAVVIQKYARRVLVVIMMRSMNNLIELRRVLARKEISKVKACLEKIDMHSGNNAALTAMFQHEVKIARVMVRLLEIQAKLIEEITTALETNDSAELNRLILKSERLEMGSNPLVMRAKEVLMKLHAKRKIMNSMVAFLKNEEEFTETILSTLHAAAEHEIDPEFIEKVRAVYDKAGPRLKSRNRLRHMIESVDRYGIEQTALEVLTIQQLQPGFAESELRAAKAMLRLLHFDEELHPVEFSDYDHQAMDDFHQPVNSYDDAASEDGQGGDRAVTFNTPAFERVDQAATLWGRKVLTRPTNPKLGREVRDVCHAILVARNPATLNTEKRRLLEIAGSVERLYDIIRYYKWSNTVCTWRYPEVMLAQEQQKARHLANIGSSSSPNATDRESIEHENEFYGLRPAEARSSAYIIRTLHKDFDPLSGSASALMQAALGSVDLPSSVSETLTNLEMLSSVDKNPVLPNGQVFQKTHVKHARTHQEVPASAPRTNTAARSSTSANGATRSGMLKSGTSTNTATMSIRPTMVAPRRREITKGETVIQNIRPQTKLEKELEFTRANKAKWTSKVDRHMDLAKKAAVPSGWK